MRRVERWPVAALPASLLRARLRGGPPPRAASVAAAKGPCAGCRRLHACRALTTRAPSQRRFASSLPALQACGSYLIVVDEVLLPLGQLPRLQTERPINGSTWARLQDVVAGRVAPPEGDHGGSSEGGDGDGDGTAEATIFKPPGQLPDADQPLAVAQAAPGAEAQLAPPDNCTMLAGSGALMLAGPNNTLTVTDCRGRAVIRNGTTQTAVSDAGQRRPSPPPPPPSAASRRQRCWPAALAAAATALACLLVGL